MTVDKEERDRSTDWTTKVAETIVEAYYPELIKIGGSARQRAQSTHAVISAMAAAAITLGLALTRDGSGLSAVAGLIALLAWAIATMLYATAISQPQGTTSDTRSGPLEFIESVIKEAAADAERVGKRTRLAVWATASALGASCVFLVLLTTRADTPALPLDQIDRLILSEEQRDAFASMCESYTSGPLKISGASREDLGVPYLAFSPDSMHGCSVTTMRIRINDLPILGAE